MNNVITIPLGVVSAFFIKGSKLVLVDTGTPGNAEKILARLNQEGLEPKSLALIIITHGHSDHLGSALDLKELTGAKIAIHKLDVDSARTGHSPPLEGIGWMGKMVGSLISRVQGSKPQFRTFEPDIIIENDMSLEEFGVDGRVIHTPGHTPGSVSVSLANGEIIVGDLIMGGFLPRKRPGLPFIASDIEKVKQSIKLILELKPKLIYVSHGGSFELAQVAEELSIS